MALFIILTAAVFVILLYGGLYYAYLKEGKRNKN